MLDADSACLRRFGFREPPFLGAPDARFTYRSAALTEAISVVVDRIGRGDRAIAVTGAPGIGKTTLCMELSRHFAEQPVSTFEPRIVIIDDAHTLDAARLRQHLHGGHGSGDPGTQTVLVGHPQLEELLDAAGCIDGAIRRIRLGPLGEGEIAEYIERRMWVARGGIDKFRESIVDDAASRHAFVWGPRISGRAVRRVAAATDGNPRAVNDICAQEIELAASRQPATLALPRPAWYTIAAGLVALAMLSVYSRGSSAHSAEGGRAPIVRPDESFDGFRRSTLQRAAALAAVPDVNALLQVRAGVLDRARNAGDPQTAVIDLLKEVDRLTNDARARQLDVDHRQMLEYAKHH